MPVSDYEIRCAFRHLLRESVRAVRFAKPARYVVREHIRDAFRKDSREDFNPAAIARTLELLQHATKIRGLEYALVRNIVKAWGVRETLPYRQQARQNVYAFRRQGGEIFDKTLARLNETMGMCIK